MERCTLKYKLRNDWGNGRDFDKLHNIINLCGCAYNHILALHRRWYSLFGTRNKAENLKFEQAHGREPAGKERRKTFLSAYDIQKHMTKLKRTKRYAWLKGIPSQALQQIAERVQHGYELFFKSTDKSKSAAVGNSNGKSKRRVSPPKFRNPHRYKSFTLKQAGWELKGDDGIRIGAWNFRFRKSRALTGTIKTVTIKRDRCGDMYVCFCCEADASQPNNRVMTGKIAGMDFGIKTFLTIAEADNQQTGLTFKAIDAPHVLNDKLSVLRGKSTKFSKKVEALKEQQKGKKQKDKPKPSKSYLRARHALAKYHRYISDMREDWQYKLARELSLAYDVIYIEDLTFSDMLESIKNAEDMSRNQKRKCVRKLADLAPYNFFLKLEQECRKNGSRLIKRDKYYASSQLCSKCGHKNPAVKNLSVRKWTCPKCGEQHDRDINAAINILTGGARPGVGTTVRRVRGGNPPQGASLLAGRVA